MGEFGGVIGPTWRESTAWWPPDPVPPEGAPNVVDMIRSGGINLVINTPFGRGARTDGYEIREAAIRHSITCITTLAGASAAVQAIAQAKTVPPVPLQDLHAEPVVEESHVVG